MKKILFTLLLPVYGVIAYAQPGNASIDMRPFLFGKFIDGVVLMKSGVVEKLPLNYNTSNQSIFFIKDGQYMQVTAPETIDTVYIQQKRFVPADGSFYEVIATAPAAALYISYTGKSRPLTATTGHDGTSKQTNNQVSNTVSDVYANRNYKGSYQVDISKHFWLVRNNTLHKVDTKKQLLKLFPGSTKAAIENYIATNEINFTNELDMIKLFTFCNSQQG